MSKSHRTNFNGPPLKGAAKPPTPVKLDALETRSIAERIEALVERVFVTDYRMPARAKSPAWRTASEPAPMAEVEPA
jgi:hypothetical protein